MVALDYASHDSLPGIASVSGTVLPGRGSPLIEGSVRVTLCAGLTPPPTGRLEDGA
jgi:hypothetical protein